ncbi:unnamed protein product [marine sediment metagenome]|uniref:Polymerase nucleotidyl transferase domain-containing protein n=1 Tax=marine sediment metagenome TaxID=412755 RepID=X1T352_9ZZZZ
MELEKAKVIARKVVKELSPYCDKIQVAGSVRRQKPTVKDIDIVLIPRRPPSLPSETYCQ